MCMYVYTYQTYMSDMRLSLGIMRRRGPYKRCSRTGGVVVPGAGEKQDLLKGDGMKAAFYLCMCTYVIYSNVYMYMQVISFHDVLRMCLF